MNFLSHHASCVFDLFYIIGLGQILFIFSGFTFKPYNETMLQRYFTTSVANLHFKGKCFKFSYLKLLNSSSNDANVE